MVSKATDSEAHRSLYPPTLRPKLHSATTWGCAAAPDAAVTHAQHCVGCRVSTPHRPTPSCTRAATSLTQNQRRKDTGCPVIWQYLISCWGGSFGIPFHLVTNIWQMFPDRRETRLQRCCSQHGLGAALLLSASTTVPYWHPLPLENVPSSPESKQHF